MKDVLEISANVMMERAEAAAVSALARHSPHILFRLTKLGAYHLFYPEESEG